MSTAQRVATGIINQSRSAAMPRFYAVSTVIIILKLRKWTPTPPIDGTDTVTAPAAQDVRGPIFETYYDNLKIDIR